ncbi:pseudouridine synthase [Heliomicrobium modesticaldum Ice1]|uniref:Pseudouridine synthase n=1 Tax=Heliobacterium modesticaldum (strain ATCC 51547 / Ice1) TaxID=498761 RepID=B0TFD8_HELMI|nr:pseudouridine synthase [Heliomicrobium modesticaldum]ABZ84455.1 pseudouridine synthase [Heliomicrobium modesticaldum Ice1]
MDSQTVRLQKLLAAHGVASRREAEAMIRAGRVRINGTVVREQGVRVDGARDVIEVDGRILKRREAPLYYALYKPRGVVTTCKDPQGRQTVIGLLSGVNERVYPVGRLDRDTEGLLLLTNDGQLAFRLTHPRFGVEKTYRARLRGDVSAGALKALAEGVQLEDGVTAPAQVRLLRREGDATWIEIKIHEGRKRQIRRMGDAIGHPVIDLERIAFGPITLGKLKPGEVRPLTSAELRALKSAAGMKEATAHGRDERRQTARPSRTAATAKVASAHKDAGKGVFKGLKGLREASNGGDGRGKSASGKRFDSGVHGKCQGKNDGGPWSRPAGPRSRV